MHKILRSLIALLLLFPSIALGTVTTTTTGVSFDCSGSVGPYDFTFPISDTSALEVIQTTGGGVSTTLTSVQYSSTPVNNDYANGGSVTLVTACPTGYTLTVRRNTPITQTSTFTEHMPTLYKTFERGLDKLTEIQQEQASLGYVIPTSATILGSDSNGRFADHSSSTLSNNITGTAAGLSGTPNISVGTISASGNITTNVTGSVTQCLQASSAGVVSGTGSACGSGGGGANASGYYLVNQAANAPANAINIGSLSTGLLKITVSGSIATPSTANAGTDYVVPSGNITGSAASLSAVSDLPNGTTATTQGTGDNSTKVATTAFVQSATVSALTGSIIIWPLPTVPSGYFECNGASLSRTTYPGLFAVIGTTYGYADSSHFYIPDYRGYFLRGWSHASGVDPDAATRTNRGDGTTGDNIGTKQASQFASHTHTGGVLTGFPEGALGEAACVSRLGNDYVGYTGGNETRPLNTYVMFCIKY